MKCPRGTRKNLKNGKCNSYSKIAIIIPYRDTSTHVRSQQLDTFIRYINNYLKGYRYTIFVIEQSEDGRKFNRGKLLNIGYLMADTYDHFIFHDVDLLPSVGLRKYYTNKNDQPVHLANVWGRYNSNSKYFGGVVSFSDHTFEKINGFPNNYWGWGGEDDELYKRTIEFYSIKKVRKGTYQDLENMTLSDKLSVLKVDQCKNNIKHELNAEHAKTWKSNGVRQTMFKELSRTECGNHCVKITVDIQLNGDWADAYAL